MNEVMTLADEHANVSYRIDFEGIDLTNIKKQLRKIDAKFSSEQVFKKDVQIVFDENYLNYFWF